MWMSFSKASIRPLLGLSKADGAILAVKDIVRPGETISSESLVKRPGGKGANQAGAIARAGAIVDLVGAVGQDGLWVRDELKEIGVCVEGVSIVEVCACNGLDHHGFILHSGKHWACTDPGQ
jgi:ribokinase